MKGDRVGAVNPRTPQGMPQATASHQIIQCALGNPGHEAGGPMGRARTHAGPLRKVMASELVVTVAASMPPCGKEGLNCRLNSGSCCEPT
eukprot:8510283-Pyramimonas_sp.AAC.1